MEAQTQPMASKTLLMVDDDPLMTTLFSQFMTKRGFRVLTATNGAEALQIAAAEAGVIQLVLTDMTMPGMDGLELARRLAASAPALPVLIATGHDTEETSASLPPNVVGVIQKPYKNRLLAERIEALLQSASSD